MTEVEERTARPRHPARLVGESYRDCIDRLAGEKRAVEIDRNALADMVIAALAIHRKAEGWHRSRLGARVDYVECRTCHQDWPCQTAEALGVKA